MNLDLASWDAFSLMLITVPTGMSPSHDECGLIPNDLAPFDQASAVLHPCCTPRADLAHRNTPHKQSSASLSRSYTELRHDQTPLRGLLCQR